MFSIGSLGIQGAVYLGSKVVQKAASSKTGQKIEWLQDLSEHSADIDRVVRSVLVIVGIILDSVAAGLLLLTSMVCIAFISFELSLLLDLAILFQLLPVVILRIHQKCCKEPEHIQYRN